MTTNKKDKRIFRKNSKKNIMPLLPELVQASANHFPEDEDGVSAWRKEKDEVLRRYQEAAEKKHQAKHEVENLRKELQSDPNNVVIIDMYIFAVEKYASSISEYFEVEMKQLCLRKEMIEMGKSGKVRVKGITCDK